MNSNNSFSIDDSLSECFHNLSVNSTTSSPYLSTNSSSIDDFSFFTFQPVGLNHPIPTPSPLAEQELPDTSSTQWDLPSFINYLRDLVDLRNPMSTQIVFNRVFSCMFQTMSNEFGHHLFKKLIDSCDEIQLQLIVNKLTSFPHSFMSACLSTYGSNSVKKLIKVLKTSPMIDDIVKLLNLSFYILMTHDIGSTVILHLLETCDAWKNVALYISTIQYALDLAIDKRGCISLNKVIDNAEGLCKYLLLDLVSRNAVWLAKDPAGNFVVQHVFIVGNPYFCNKVCSVLRGHFVEISMQKAGSFVVERCLNSEGMSYVVEDLLECNELWRVATHKFGNFAIQCALKATAERNGLLYRQLVNKLQERIDSLRFGIGRHVLRLLNGEGDY